MAWAGLPESQTKTVPGPSPPFPPLDAAAGNLVAVPRSWTAWQLGVALGVDFVRCKTKFSLLGRQS